MCTLQSGLDLGLFWSATCSLKNHILLQSIEMFLRWRLHFSTPVTSKWYHLTNSQQWNMGKINLCLFWANRFKEGLFLPQPFSALIVQLVKDQRELKDLHQPRSVNNSMYLAPPTTHSLNPILTLLSIRHIWLGVYMSEN